MVIGVVSATIGQDVVDRGPRLRLGGSDGDGDISGGWDHARRTLVVGDQLWVLGDSSLRAFDLTTLAEQARVRL